MDNSEFKEIMEALKEIAIEQAVIHEKMESSIKKSDKQEESVKELEKTVQRHDLFMKVTLWACSALVSIFGFKSFFWK